MTQCEAETLVTRLVEAFPGSRMETGNCRAYAEHILEFDGAAGLRALADLVERTDRFPSIAALRKAIKAQGGKLSGLQAALATAPNPACDLCRGVGWHWLDWRTVTPCRCRWARGAGPDPLPPVRREALPEDVREALTAFEFATGSPVEPGSLRMVLHDVQALGAERTASGIALAAARAEGGGL